jgi:hypothetical protein
MHPPPHQQFNPDPALDTGPCTSKDPRPHKAFCTVVPERTLAAQESLRITDGHGQLPVLPDRQLLGHVRYFSAMAGLNAGDDPRERMAQRLNDTEASAGPDTLRRALQSTFDVG